MVWSGGGINCYCQKEAAVLDNTVAIEDFKLICGLLSKPYLDLGSDVVVVT